MLREAELASDDQVFSWAATALSESADGPWRSDLAALLSVPTDGAEVAERLRQLLSNRIEDLSPTEDDSRAAHAAFVQVVEAFVAGKTAPYDLCRRITPIEVVFDFPEWLGNFYHQCDWCEPESSRDDWQELVAYARDYLEQMRVEMASPHGHHEQG